MKLLSGEEDQREMKAFYICCIKDLTPPEDVFQRVQEQHPQAVCLTGKGKINKTAQRKGGGNRNDYYPRRKY